MHSHLVPNLLLPLQLRHVAPLSQVKQEDKHDLQSPFASLYVPVLHTHYEPFLSEEHVKQVSLELHVRHVLKQLTQVPFNS